MPGETTTGSLRTALPAIVGDARIVHEEEGTYMRTTDHRRQQPGTGLEWTEFAVDQMQADDITEATQNENYQTFSGTLISVEPDMTQIVIKITDRTYRKIADIVEGKLGTIAGNAMARKKDEDYLDLFSTFSTTVSPGTGNPLSFSYIAAGVNNIQSNTTETSKAEVYTVLHGFQKYDIQNEILAGVGTYTVPDGLTEEVFRKGFSGTVAESNLFTDGNITVDTVPDANGAVHAREGVISVDALELRKATDRDELFGGGADIIILTAEYAFKVRLANWVYLLKADATAPTG